MLSKFGATPQSTAMIGDSFTKDIEPAQALGIFSIQTTEFEGDEKSFDLRTQQAVKKHDQGFMIVDELNDVSELLI